MRTRLALFVTWGVLFPGSVGMSKPLQRLWGHQASHCIQGVAEELCEIAKIAETIQANQAQAKLEKLEAKYTALPAQKPAFLSLLFLAAEQARMNQNGSGATDSQEDPDGTILEGMRLRPIQAFQNAPMEDLPYLPIPLLKVIGRFIHANPEKHRALTIRIEKAVYAMRNPLDIEAVSFLDILASHRGGYDPKGSIKMFEKARQALGNTTQDQSFRIALLLSEASVRGEDTNWDVFESKAYGFEHLVQALVLMNRTPKLSSADFREHFTRATETLKLRRMWIKKQRHWNDEVQAKAWQADAMIELLQRKRPQDAKSNH